MRSLDAAILVVDISGFTNMTEKLSHRDAAGVELLTKCINSFFSQVIHLVLSHGGDVMRFAGDSMICCFSPSADESLLPDSGLEQATLRCLQLATALTRDLGKPLPSYHSSAQAAEVAMYCLHNRAQLHGAAFQGSCLTWEEQHSLLWLPCSNLDGAIMQSLAFELSLLTRRMLSGTPLCKKY